MKILQQIGLAKKIFWTPSIRNYLILMNLILLGLLFPAISIVFLNEEAKFRDAQLENTLTQMRSSLERRSASLALSMSLSATQAIAGYDYTSLNIMVQQVVRNDPEIVYALVMNKDRFVISHNNEEQVGAILSSEIDYKVADLLKNKFPKTISDNYKRSSDVHFYAHEITNESEKIPVMEVVAPVFSGNTLWGALRCGFSLKGLLQETENVEHYWTRKTNQFKKYLITMTATFFTIGVLIAAFFTRPFIRAVQTLSSGVMRISTGDLDHEIKQGGGLVCSEFLDLSRSFNKMTEKLKVSYEKLDEYSRSLEQKVDERTKELKEAQDSLIRQAHEAGMAEMAVGVLHNIGNAITPAKVNASLLLKRLKESPFRTHLDKTLLRIDESVLKDESLAADEKKRLREILKLLPETLKNDYDAVVKEIQRIMSKHEHIESIIRLQMNYAQLVGDHEFIEVNSVIDDALSIIGDSLQKRSVSVQKNTSELPSVKFVKSKLLQIIINLLKNAYEAMEDIPSTERTLTISTGFDQGPPAFISIVIEDTGIGFSPEESEKLFTFGYSTKKKGSGFGLHSSANYLIANKGSIAAHSEGKGKGARFEVRLPA